MKVIINSHLIEFLAQQNETVQHISYNVRTEDWNKIYLMEWICIWVGSGD